MADVAVVDDSVTALVQTGLKRVEVRSPAVHLASGARMDGDRLQRIAVEDGQHPEDFIGTVPAQAHFNRKPTGQRAQGFVEEFVHLFGKRQQAGTAAFLGHRPERAAQVPVYLRIAHLEEPPGEENKIVGVVSQDLGFDGHAGVVVRQEVLDMFFGEPVGGHCGDKWSQGGVEAVEVLGEGVAKDRIGKAFQRSQDQSRSSAIGRHIATITAGMRQVKLPDEATGHGLHPDGKCSKSRCI